MYSNFCQYISLLAAAPIFAKMTGEKSEQEQVKKSESKVTTSKPLQKEQEETMQRAKDTFALVVETYISRKNRIRELEKKIERLRALNDEDEKEFEFLGKISKKINEVGRNTIGIGEALKKEKDEKPARKRKRESAEKEVVSVKKLMKALRDSKSSMEEVE